MSKINVRLLSAEICGLFEDLLAENDIYIPNEDREGEPEEACIYGTDYYDLEDSVTECLVKLANEIKRDNIELETRSCDFTKLINGIYYVEE